MSNNLTNHGIDVPFRLFNNAVYLEVSYLHVSREDVHGFGSSRDVGHGLAAVGDVQILHQDVVQHQLFEEPVSVVPGVGGAHPVQPRLDLGGLAP